MPIRTIDKIYTKIRAGVAAVPLSDLESFELLHLFNLSGVNPIGPPLLKLVRINQLRVAHCNYLKLANMTPEERKKHRDAIFDRTVKKVRSLNLPAYDVFEAAVQVGLAPANWPLTYFQVLENVLPEVQELILRFCNRDTSAKSAFLTLCRTLSPIPELNPVYRGRTGWYKIRLCNLYLRLIMRTSLHELINYANQREIPLPVVLNHINVAMTIYRHASSPLG